ncbi:MAG: polyprenol monophosphomannose synthase [Candidatus Sumerlaeaceae bacterium]
MRILAMLPTYNEAENIGPLMDQILALGPEYEALVIDDDSPDGTWKIVQELSQKDARVHLLHRTTERGRGTAGLAGFRWARDRGCDAVVEMDADFSHAPRFIPSLIEPLRNGNADLVIGSRLIKGGGETGRHPIRRCITLAANTYIRLLLGIGIRDCTSGFRTFNQRALLAIPWERMQARGPEIVQEVLLEARNAGLKMSERPILFEERRAGQSTFNVGIMLRSFVFVLKARLLR